MEADRGAAHSKQESRRDQEVEMMVSVASLGGTVAGVDHRGRKKDFVEVRERKER
jgi:hypothetical protein